MVSTNFYCGTMCVIEGVFSSFIFYTKEKVEQDSRYCLRALSVP
ncbi:hypothetical protein VCHA53O466_40098 [Vibrio chagasii]|nr:hypothetical protein VCHA53O466_40098 [Vibrio chagasii]